MKIGIKGYIGSGKTTISQLLKKEFGFYLINADEIVADLYKNDKELQEEIKDLFSLEIFDKKKISSIVFSNKEKLKNLEDIVHPILKGEIKKLSSENENVIIDCQVLDKLDINLDGEIIVYANKKTIIDRVQKRDNRSVEEIEKILNLQEKYVIQKNRTFTIDSQKNEKEIKEDLKKIIKIFNNHIKNKEENLYEENR